MNDIEKKELASMIQMLFNTRNQVAGVETLTSWGTFLRDYNIDRLREVFTRYIKYGDSFPSLPAIIALIENRVDSDTASIEAWASVRKAMKASTSKGMTPAEKTILDRVEPNGLTGCIDASDFKLQQIERDFKKMYKSAYDGINRDISIDSTGAVQMLQTEQKQIAQPYGIFKND